MPNGVKPGERRGGRKKGTPNRATLERTLLAQRVLEEQRGKPGRKLAKEILDDFMHLFMGMAARHQPLQANVIPANEQKPDEAKFLMYARLAVETAAQLAPYQSPKLKAVIVSQNPLPGEVSVGGSASDALQSAEKLTPSEAYRRFRDMDIIDVP